MLLLNATVATMTNDPPAGNDKSVTAYGLIHNAAIVIDDNKISWVGPQSSLPAGFENLEQTDLDGRLVTPALIDCHTHIVHGSHRASEFEMRLNGASYEEVARAGGGIVSTVKATRGATVSELIESALPRLDAFLAEGVSLIEIKSGYGLDIETELNMLRAAREIEKHRPVRVRTSFLGAHAVPAEYTADQYIDEICIPALKAAHREGLVDAVDGFCEGIAFNTDQIERVFKIAVSLNLPVKLHAEQLSHLGGVQLAAKYSAVSADHVEYAEESDAKAMADAGTVAVLLPGAFYTVRETQRPPVQEFRKHKVPMAIASDCNPGSSPLTSLLLAMNMACTLFRMTPQETLAGVTVEAAKALNVTDTGQIKPGLRADLCVWNVKEPAELSYRIGFNPLHSRYFAGKISSHAVGTG